MTNEIQMASLGAASKLSPRQLPKLKFTDQVSALLDRRINHHGVLRRMDPIDASMGWGRLAVELDHWRRAKRQPQLWWRDDDAFELSMQLRRLVECAREADVPISLSVIPKLLSPELCTWVNSHPFITILQHGTDHRDVGTGPSPAQFDQNEPAEAVAQCLADGWSAMSGFQRRVPVYVPPWHVLSTTTINAASMAGLASVSAWGRPSAPGRVDVHVDLMRWRGPPRFAGSLRVLGKLTRELSRRRLQEQWQEPIGILTHHLVHDDAAWRFLVSLLHFEPLRRIASWQSADILFGVNLTQTSGACSNPPVTQLSDQISKERTYLARRVDGYSSNLRIPGAINRLWERGDSPNPNLSKGFVGVLLIFAAWTLRWGLSPLLHEQSPYVTFALMALIAAHFQGLKTGLATTIIGVLIANYSFVGPPNQLDFGGTYKWNFIVFIATTLPLILIFNRSIHKNKKTYPEI